MTCAEIGQLVNGFEDTSLPKEQWTHAAHVTVALYYVRTLGATVAAARMREAIQRFNAAKGGARTAYHETITLAWIAVINGFLAKADVGQPLPDLIAALLKETGDKHYLQRHYSPDVLMSDQARTTWVPPDRRSFEDSAIGGSTGAGSAVQHATAGPNPQ
jgi:hypothetical protein